MTVADQAMHLIVREVEELDRVANPVAPEPLNPQDRVFECHGERGMVSALGLAFGTGSELGAFNRAKLALARRKLDSICRKTPSSIEA